VKHFLWKIWLWFTLRRVCPECNGYGLVDLSRAHQPAHERSCGLCNGEGWLAREKYYALFWWIYCKLPHKKEEK